jgi:hypothetical protein
MREDTLRDERFEVRVSFDERRGYVAHANGLGSEGDWPSYNKTLTSNRFSELSQINRTNAEKLLHLRQRDRYQSSHSLPLRNGSRRVFLHLSHSSSYSDGARDTRPGTDLSKFVRLRVSPSSAHCRR